MKTYRENGFEIDEDEYKKIVILLKQASEMGINIEKINKNNKFSTELANLIHLNKNEM